jgi:hypothetical protein
VDSLVNNQTVLVPEHLGAVQTLKLEKRKVKINFFINALALLNVIMDNVISQVIFKLISSFTKFRRMGSWLIQLFNVIKYVLDKSVA